MELVLPEEDTRSDEEVFKKLLAMHSFMNREFTFENATFDLEDPREPDFPRTPIAKRPRNNAVEEDTL